MHRKYKHCKKVIKMRCSLWTRNGLGSFKWSKKYLKKLEPAVSRNKNFLNREPGKSCSSATTDNHVKRTFVWLNNYKLNSSGKMLSLKSKNRKSSSVNSRLIIWMTSTNEFSTLGIKTVVIALCPRRWSFLLFLIVRLSPWKTLWDECESASEWCYFLIIFRL